MEVKYITTDCDKDSLLIQVIPMGPACHLGYAPCFQPAAASPGGFLGDRAMNLDPHSYTSELIAAGINRCAQQVGEEAVETVIAAVSNNREELITETADRLFHLLVLLQVSQVRFLDVLACLQARHAVRKIDK